MTRRPLVALAGLAWTLACSEVPVEQVARSTVDLVADSVFLDYTAREMEIRGTLINTGPARPDTVWVWAYFINPSVATQGSWSDAPIAVVAPFVTSDTASFVARGSFHWATNRELPKSGFYARVAVSPVAADSAQVPSTNRLYSAAGAVPVQLVQ